MVGTVRMLFHRKRTTTDADRCLAKKIPPDIYQTHILPKLDGASLASIVAAFPQFLSTCKDDELWRKICNSVWPSTTHPSVLRAISAFPSAHRSFYLDSFPSASHRLPRLTCLSDTSSLISAVDIYYRDEVIYSKVLETETTSDNFFEKGLYLDLLVPSQTVPTPVKYQGDQRLGDGEPLTEGLRVSWIMIDPCNKRAVNVASHKVVHSSVDESIRLCYATVAAVPTGELVKFNVGVTSGWRLRELHMKAVSMRIVSRQRGTLNGRESMGVLQMAMEGARRMRIDSKTEKANYNKFKTEGCCPYEVIIFFPLAFVSLVTLVFALFIFSGQEPSDK